MLDDVQQVPHVIYTKSDGFESQPFLEKAVMEHEGTFALRWPAEVLAALVGVAARCCISHSHRKRTTIAAELPALERLCESVRQMHGPYARLRQQQ